MKYLIIGSKGFIGKNLFEYFQNSHDIIVWGADIIFDLENLSNYFFLDSLNPDYNLLFNFETFDVCINCSGAANVGDSLINPLRDFQLNTLNVFKILDAIRTFQPTCKFINLSSAAVYGNPVILPISESALTLPLSPYGFHKM
ncbi:SDR family oxidoreductase, partial [Algoriphagus lacus]